MSKYHGGAKALEEGQADSRELYDYFLKKRILNDEAISNDVILKMDYESISPAPSDLLMVIDMQNDFLDVQNDKLKGPKNIGTFAVNNGKDIIEPMLKLIDKFDKSNSQIVFTRDVHTCDHCSFFESGCTRKENRKTPSGIFPPHCINQSYGSGFAPKILGFLKTKTKTKKIGKIGKDGKNIAVVFKGCQQNVDSFAGFPYPVESEVDIEYALSGQRQRLPKSTEEAVDDRRVNGYERQTVSSSNKIIQKVSDSDKRKPELSKCTQDAEEIKINSGTFYADKPSDPNIIESFFNTNGLIKPENRFDVPEIIKNIYVVGLAGDWCVRDTALNLAKKYKGSKNVYVIHDLTRNAMVPTHNHDDAFLKVFLENIKINTTKGPDAKDTVKNLSHYIFEFGVNAQGVYNYKSLDHKAREGLKEEDLKIKGKYFHFLTDITDIFQSYKDAGVKVYINPGYEALSNGPSDDSSAGHSDISSQEGQEQEQEEGGGKRYRKTHNKRSKKSKALHLFSFKMPTKRAVRSGEGDAGFASKMRNGVKRRTFKHKARKSKARKSNVGKRHTRR
jgi:nicotinamidase-related amidase